MEHLENSRIIRTLETLLRLPNGSLKGPDLLSGLATWDSLAVVEFIMSMDEDFAVEMKAEEVRECKTVRDLLDLAETKASEKNASR